MAVAAIFDLDGTLVTFDLDIREWRKVILGLMEERGFETAGLTLTTPTQQILDAARDQGSPHSSLDYGGFRREAFAALDSLEVAGVATAVIFPDARQVLRRLKSGGVRLGMLTNSGRAAALKTLDRWDLGNFFEFVLTRDDTETMKPRPEGLTKAVSLLRVRADEAYYIGDSRYDIMAAREAGVKSVAVATGGYTEERLRDEGADVVIGGLSGLLNLFGV